MSKFKVGDHVVRVEGTSTLSAPWLKFLSSPKSKSVLVVTYVDNDVININNFNYGGDQTPFYEMNFKLIEEPEMVVKDYCSNLKNAHIELERLSNLYKETWGKIKIAQDAYNKAGEDLKGFMKSLGIDEL